MGLIAALVGIGLGLWYIITSLGIAFASGYGPTRAWFAENTFTIFGLTLWDAAVIYPIYWISRVVWGWYEYWGSVMLAAGSFMFFQLASMFWVAWIQGRLPFGWAFLNFVIYVSAGVWISHTMGWLDGQRILVKKGVSRIWDEFKGFW